MAETKAKTDGKAKQAAEDAPDLHEFHVRTRRVYRHNGNTYRGGAKLWLPMDEGKANRDALRLIKDSNK